jgi:DNA repair exonuclease SbcCD ATPase subunit
MINNIKLKNTFIHESVDISFKPGINIITGENRKGKSSICEAMCYAITGATNRSSLSRLIKDNEKKSEVTLSYSDKPEFTRIRTATTGNITGGMTKAEVDSFFNISPKIFNSLFYVSSNDDFSLFDSSYLAKFLESIFNLDKYSTIYKKLSIEMNSLKSVIEAPKQEVITEEEKALNRIKLTKLNTDIIVVQEKILKAKDAIGKLKTESNFLYNEYITASNALKSNDEYITSLQNNICPTCGREYEEKPSEELIKESKIISVAHRCKMNDSFNKYNKIENDIKKVNEAYYKLVELQSRINSDISNIKYINSIKPASIPESITKRYNDIHAIIDTFKPSGFPLYVVQHYTPPIEVVANKLATSIFEDLSLDISFNTKSNGNLDIAVNTCIRGSRRPLKDVCGSEMILINLCLRLAVIYVFKKLNNTNIDVFIIDEGFEKFDSSTSVKVINLLNKCIETGIIKQCIAVTHKQELKNLDGVNYVRL